MSIEFHCIKCGTLLRVPDEIYGHKTKCPNCEEVQTVYAKANVVNAAAVDYMKYEAPAYRDTGNPYQAPIGDYAVEEEKIGELVHTRVNVINMIQDTADIFIGRITDFIFLGLITLGVNVFFFILMQAFSVIVGSVENDRFLSIIAGCVVIAISILANIAWIVLFAAGTRYALHVARGGESNLSIAFQKPERLFYSIIPTFFFWIILSMIAAAPIIIAVMVGSQLNSFGDDTTNMVLIFITVACITIFVMMLLVFAAAKLLWYICFFIDRDEGPLRCFSSSVQFSAGNVVALAAFLLVWNIIVGVFHVCSCGIGGIFTIPLMNCYIAVAYLSMTGQPYQNPKKAYNPGASQEFDTW